MRSGLPAADWKIGPLASEKTTVCSAPAAEKIYLGAPSIACLPGGRVLAAVDQSGSGVSRLPGAKGKLYYSHHWVLGRIFVSKDKGQTWTQKGEFPFCSACLFTDGEALYLIGHRGTVEIMKSADGGETWTKPTELTSRDDAGGSFVRGPANVLHANGRIYAALMCMADPANPRARGSARAVVVASARQGSALTTRKSWTFSAPSRTLPALAPVEELDYFGVPFYEAPRNPHARNAAEGPPPHRLAWSDAHLLQIRDPAHFLHDPTGHTLHVLAQASVYRSNMAVLAKAVEDEAGVLAIGPQTTPAGRRLMFLPLPGGNLRFHVLFDEASGLYWLASNQVTDSMRPARNKSGRVSALPHSENNRLQLHFSRNLVDWCFAGLIDAGLERNDVRLETRMAVRGGDLCLVTCTGETLSFAMVTDFRDLVY